MLVASYDSPVSDWLFINPLCETSQFPLGLNLLFSNTSLHINGCLRMLTLSCQLSFFQKDGSQHQGNIVFTVTDIEIPFL